MGFRAVVFDWRGTLVRTQSTHEWVADAFDRLGVSPSPSQLDYTVMSIIEANGTNDALDAPGLDANPEHHHLAYMEVFNDAGLTKELAAALYESESDFRRNPFALDARDTILALKDSGHSVAILSDIHFDPRPAFQVANILGLVDAFALSYELGVQKPDPAIFHAALGMLGTLAKDTLMVGDRARPDGAAVDMGMTTLLLPPLQEVTDRRLHRVLSLCAVAP